MPDLSKPQKTAIQRVISQALATVRPDEVFLVQNIFDPPVKVKKRTEALGFGTGIEVVLWMYPILDIFSELANTALKEFAKKWGDHLDEWLWHSSPSSKVLEPNALSTFRSRIVERLEAAGASAKEANRAGDSVVAVMVEQSSLVREIAGAK